MRPSPLARYLLGAYALLIVFASLHPLSGWRDQGVAAFAYLIAPVPRYIGAFDIVANVIGYAPLGFLAVLASYPAFRGGLCVLAVTAAAALFSAAMEALQTFVPTRIPSNLDLLANIAGAFAGALIANAFAPRLLRDQGLHALRHRLFLPGGKVDFGLVLLGLWLFTQLNPATLLFGNGDLRELFHELPGTLHPAELFIRVEATVACANAVAVGLLAASLARSPRYRISVALALLAAALAARTLAFGVLFSPNDPLTWLTPGAALGVAAGAVVTLVAQSLPHAARLAAGGLALMIATAVVNFAPENPYLSFSLSLWRQGPFFNLNGLTRVVSAIWPFLALGYLMVFAGDRGRPKE